MKRLLLFIALLSGFVLGCHAALTPLAAGTSQAERALFDGSLILASSTYKSQAIASNLASGATVSLIDPATSQVKGTGVTSATGTFTVTALPAFTPTLNTLYVLEAEKTLGGAGNGTFALRTLISLTPAGWTSISGSTITISTMTTAVSLLYRYRGLGPADVLGKVAYDAASGRSTPSALDGAISDAAVRQVETRVQQALAGNLDPMQVLHPALDGSFGISLATGSLNLVNNPGFELPGATPYWAVGGASGSLILSATTDSSAAYEGRAAEKLVVSNAGDAWFGEGNNSSPQHSVLALVAGQTYTFSLYAKGAVGGEALGLRVSALQPGFSELNLANVALTTGWQRYSYTFTAPASTVSGLLFVRLGSIVGQATYPETVWIDAVQLEASPNASAFAPAQGHLIYDSTTTPKAGSAGYTYGPGHNGGTGLVLDSGINFLQNGHAQSGTANWAWTSTATLSVAGTYGTPPNDPIGQTFVFTRDGSANCCEWPYERLNNLVPNTNYTVSYWTYFPSASDPASMTSGAQVLSSTGIGIGFGTQPVTLNQWYKQTFTFNSGSYAYVDVLPCDLPSPNAVCAFTMVQVEQGQTAHSYAGSPGLDRYTIDSRYIPRAAGTIEYWFQPFYDSSDTRYDNAGGTSLCGISQYTDACVFTLNKQGNGLNFGIHDACGWHSPTWTASTPLWSAMTWHHVAMTWGDPSGMKLFFDGQQVLSDPYSGGIYNQSGCQVGPASALGYLYLSGVSQNQTYIQDATLDQLRIYDYPRGAADIARDYLGVQSPVGL